MNKTHLVTSSDNKNVFKGPQKQVLFSEAEGRKKLAMSITNTESRVTVKPIR